MIYDAKRMTDDGKKEGAPWWVYAVIIGFTLFMIGAGMAPHFYPHYFGATAENISDVALSQTPKGLARALPCTETHRTEVETKFRHTVTSFEKATFDWRESPDQVSGISLHAEREHEESKNKKEGSSGPRPLAGKLDDVLPGVNDSGKREWGFVRFDADKTGDLSFEVKGAGDNHQPNPLFARQVEAARQILVEVAFDIPHTVSKQELADTLGTGYPIAVLATVDPAAPPAETLRALNAKLAAALVDNDRIRVPIEHTVVSEATLRWTPFRRKGFELSFRATRKFLDHRAAFITCLEEKTGSPALHDGTIAVIRFGAITGPGIQINVNDAKVETFTYDAGANTATFSALIGAMDACSVK